MCLNGNFDTFCFDFTNVTKVTVRKYFGPPMRSQILVCTDELPRQALWKGIAAAGRRGLGAKSLHTFPGATDSLWLHQGGRNPSAPPVCRGTRGAARTNHR